MQKISGEERVTIVLTLNWALGRLGELVGISSKEARRRCSEKTRGGEVRVAKLGAFLFSRTKAEN